MNGNESQHNHGAHVSAHGDSVSDPAHNDEQGHDWTDEGGAMNEGPATHASHSSNKDDDILEEDILEEG
ncbi:MAG: hypothetical protein WBA28_07620 [Microbacteriaceae bacterium]